MIDLLTLTYAREIEQDGEKMLDLTETVYHNGAVIKIDRVVLINEEYEGRPAYLAKVLLGKEDYLDILMSINGVSDPMSLQAGSQIMVPDLKSAQDAMKNNNIDSSGNNGAKKALNKKYNNVDPNRAIMAGPKKVLEARTTNMTKDDTPAVTVGDGVIILGTNISDTRCGSELSATQTRTEVIRKAVQEKIMAKTIARVLDTRRPAVLSLSANDKTDFIPTVDRQVTVRVLGG